jgi:hypothetical protein
MKQKTDEWLNIRKGKFTGSEIWKLMTEPRSKSELFSETAKTYILEKIAEENSIDSHDNGFTTMAMQWGIDNEPVAKRHYERLTGSSIMEVGFIQLEDFENECGGSPDGLVDYRKIIEIKCPYSQANHIKHILVSEENFKSELKEYYWQMQFYMGCYDEVEECDFISFDPRIVKEWTMHIKPIKRNNEDIALMRNKIKIATDYKNEIQSRLI